MRAQQHLCPGTYYAALFYKTGTQDWTIVSDGSYTNLKTI